jgi:hypothetical protein
MKQIKQLFFRIFSRRKPVYGAKIFQQRSWLAKKVDDALWDRYHNVN